MKINLGVLLVGSALLLGACQTSGGVSWPDFQPRLQPGASSSPVKAALPAGIQLTAASTNNAEKAAYGGVWEGWMCRDRIVDGKVAVFDVSEEGATVEYAAGAQRFNQYNERLNLVFVDGANALDGRFASGIRLTLALRSDGHMDIKYDDRGNWCTGILRRTERPPVA